MKHAFYTALGCVGLASAAFAQNTDITAMDAEDILKMQIGAGQTSAQLEEQLADQLDFDTEDQFDARRQVKAYVETLIGQATELPETSLSATLPIREITYDFDLKTYRLCLPSSMLFSTAVEGGTVEALVGFRFGDMAEKDADSCPHLKPGFTPGTTLGVSNYAEFEMEMAQAEKLHNAIEAGESMASFSCDETLYVQGRFDTGPTQLVCIASSVALSVMDGPDLTFSDGGDDSWITRSGGSADAGTADSGSDMADGDDSTETAAVDTPGTNAPPQAEPGTILTEAALALTRSDRLAIQRRLNLLGYSTRGVDGVFGPGTRAGISQWQVKNGLPISGYLSAGQLTVLNTTSEALYQQWLVNNANTSTSTTRSTNTGRKVYRGRDGCLRTRPGNARRAIIPGQSRYCNQRRRGKI